MQLTASLQRRCVRPIEAVSRSLHGLSPFRPGNSRSRCNIAMLGPWRLCFGRHMVFRRLDHAAHGLDAGCNIQPIEALSWSRVNFSPFELTHSMPQCNAFKACSPTWQLYKEDVTAYKVVCTAAYQTSNLSGWIFDTISVSEACCCWSGKVIDGGYLSFDGA